MDRIEMEVARIAARERRTALIAGAAVAALALAVIAFALVTQQRASAGGQRVVTQRIAAAAPQSAPTANGAPGDGAADPTAGSPASHGVAPSGSGTGASESDDVDRLPMTSQSASQFMALYQGAGETFGVNWRLIASIHQQETAFSSAPGTYRGLNFAGCCAGPMQFNVTNGRVSTWERFRDAFRRAERPAQYPHRTRRHPSVYDDFDAIMAAGALLRANGAGERLDGSAWLASYHYYGHDFTGLRYADQVLARAVGWAQDGLCVQCPVDAQLAARFDAAFAAPYRAELVAAERQARARERAKARARARREREHRKRVHEARERARAARRRAAREADRKARTRREAAEDAAKAKAAPKAEREPDPPARNAAPDPNPEPKSAAPPPPAAPAPTATAPLAPASATAPPPAAAPPAAGPPPG
jgi:hypothetical protein